MSITIDQAGRLVVPKALRERFGLSPGAEIEIEPLADGLRLRVRTSEPTFVEKDGLLVHHGGGHLSDLDSTAFINHQRQSRAISATS